MRRSAFADLVTADPGIDLVSAHVMAYTVTDERPPF